jgi:hypothetical protein
MRHPGKLLRDLEGHALSKIPIPFPLKHFTTSPDRLPGASLLPFIRRCLPPLNRRQPSQHQRSNRPALRRRPMPLPLPSLPGPCSPRHSHTESARRCQVFSPPACQPQLPPRSSPGLFSASFASPKFATPLHASKIGFVPSKSTFHSRPPSRNNRSCCAARCVLDFLQEAGLA